MKKKLAIIFMSFGMTFPVQAEILHTISEHETVTKGVELLKDQHLTSKGWQDVYVLKINLNEDNVKVEPLTPKELDEKETVLNLVDEAGAVAGMNADFFSMSMNTPSFGPIWADGDVLQAYTTQLVGVGPVMDMATLVINDNNNILMDYYDTRVNLIVDGKIVGEANGFNKITQNLTMPVVMDTRYLSNTQSIMDKYPNTCTIVVEDGTVKTQLTGGEATNIPKDGYVILMDKEYASEYFDKIPVGSKFEVEVEIYLGEDIINNIDLGIGGGGVIIEDGTASIEPSNIVGKNTRNPRSIVANTENQGEILLIGIDGRGDSIGATHQEVVDLLEYYNAKDAMYLDGGGSTTVVARPAGKFDAKVQNVPSNGQEREVINGLGVFSTKQPGELDRLYIDFSKTHPSIDEATIIEVTGVDENGNPIQINSDDVNFTVIGIEGDFIDNIFYPKTSGKGLIIAEVGNTEIAQEIFVSEIPDGTLISSDTPRVEAETLQTFENYIPKWGGNTSQITGLVEKSTEAKHNGTSSAKMLYSLGKSKNKQVAYVVFDEPISIPENATSLSMWVKAENQDGTLKVELMDENAKTHYLTLTDHLDFEGWKKLNVPLLDYAPSKLTKIYTTVDKTSKPMVHTLYFDDIAVVKDISNETKNQFLTDPMYRKNLLEDDSGGYVVDLEEVAFDNYDGYLEINDRDVDVIMIDTNSGGLGTQWNKLKYSLEHSDANNIVLVMKNNPLNTFKDKKEGEALHNYLLEYKDNTGKNIFVINDNAKDQNITIKDDIRYIDNTELGGKFKVLDENIFYSI
ncbi:hypothetical protein AN639_11210 [Candidatus Epulonipiscium fishelsonii]|uniref:Uncharacterized protein n=1 Tax=Candidatus Epulonipiscium fishelsonii TaxID=77094 RepID=A0ACC8X986_9FIRM|nr:hypothetical protein AN396_10340 [Epulopiscium sp. SCG-B11WGA-EpuloA1]ONI43158.1 hypothetical protein AN639_11210 [Epulopiscium sp. SCG-B05WGA-EpuloA1]